MHRASFLGLLGSLAIAASAAGNEAIPREPPLGSFPPIELVSSSKNGVTLTFELRDLDIEDISRETFLRVSIPGAGAAAKAGEAELPTYSTLIAIPDRAGVRVRSTPLEVEESTGHRLLPGEGRASGDASIAHDRATLDAAPDVTVSRPMIFRDLRVVSLNLRPVHHDPATGALTVTRRMEVEVEFTGTAPDNEPENPRRSFRRAIPPSFDRLYRDLVMNYTGPESGQSIAPGTYLVICPNNPAVIETLQPLLDWRRRQGFSTILAHTGRTHPTADAIKDYIRELYEDPAINLEYVVLAGDHTRPYAVPTWFENVSGLDGEGDHPYTQLAGDDILPDIHIGRLSYGTTTELERIVNKILAYETDPWLEDDPGWFTRAALVGDPNESGRSTVMCNQWVKSRLLDIGYTEVDTVWSDFNTRMVEVFDRGDTILGYRGWYGMSGWSQAHTYTMENGRKMPFAVIMTCDTGSFAHGTSFSEGFLRAGSGTTDMKGAIGAIGTATGGTHTRYNNCMYYGVFRGLLWDGPATMGAALTRGKLELYLNYQETEPAVVELWSTWNNLIGDPALDVFTGYPAPLAVDHPASITLGANAVIVTVTDGAAPVAGAQVCLAKEEEVHAVGLTDDRGTIDLAIEPRTTGDMRLTVTRHNHYPYLATIPVANETVYVGYVDSDIDDDDDGGSSGNGDGVVNPGERIELEVGLRNFSRSPAENVMATLSSEDPLVRILDGEEWYGTIPGSATAWGPEDFDIEIAPDCPHGHRIRLGLEVSALPGRWHSLVELTAVAADLVPGPITLHDSANGRLDPGEELEMSVGLTNLGGAPATDVTGTLLSLSRFVTVPDPTVSYGTIDRGATGENMSDPFRIAAHPGTFHGHLASFLLITTFSGGISDTTTLALDVGSCSSTDPVGPDQHGYHAFDDTDTAYPEAPAYGWIELDPVLGGDGTEVVLGDFGNYQDRSRIVDLPFHFRYYGQTYTKATICSNGWIAMGTTYLTVYRNWTIPAAGGPGAMLAVFWDDLHQAPRPGTPPLPPTGVFQKYDEANHRWIVEWSNVGNDTGAVQTFEAILYDSSHHATDTGDGLIVYQYKTVVNNEIVDGYATVGIESPDQSDGLLYTYANRYPQGAAPLTDGRAIRFVPVGTSPAIALDPRPAARPIATALDPCRPNPFNPSTAISYRLGEAGTVRLRIYDVSGRLVRTLENGRVERGEHDLSWDGRSDAARPVAAGSYFLRLEAPGFDHVQRLTLLP